MKADIVDRRAVIAALPNMNLRRFKRTRVYQLLRIHESRMTTQVVYYPRKQVLQAFKLCGLPSDLV